MKSPWLSQLAEGRVFELRSKSKRFPPPCALVINDKDSGWNTRIVVAVDQYGVIGNSIYARRHNPNIYVEGLRREQFNSSHITRRRRDLERFDADDVALIRYGMAIDFTGRIHGLYSDIHLPTVVPSEWTVFWLAAWSGEDYQWVDRDPALTRLLEGAWYFESHGGARRLGYRFGFAWATRHTGARLEQIKTFLRRRWGSRLIEQHVKVVQWVEGNNIFTEEIRRECPPLGSRACLVQTPHGIQGIYR